MMTLLEILDSAIKIGLGAIISAIATYKATSQNHKNEKSKEERQYKIKNLELVSDKYEIFFVSANNFINRIGGILRNRETNEEFDFPEEKIASVKARIDPLFKALEGVVQARSRLRVIGEPGTDPHQRDLISSIEELKDLVLIKKRAPSKDFLDKKRADIVKAINAIQLELNKISKKIYD